jgi:glycosyltransferase involved in cell wall biosynthesis
MLSGIAIGDPLGGAERFGVDLARNLDRSRFEPRIYALWRFSTEAERHWLSLLTDEGITVLFAAPATVKHPLSFSRALESIVRQNGSQQTDVMHSHVPLASLAAALLKRRLGARALVRTSQAGREWGDGPVSWLARQVFTNWVYPLVFDQEACISAGMKQRFDRRPGARLAKKTALLTYNSIDLERYRPRENREAMRQRLGLPLAAPVVGSVGRLRQEKGFGDLLTAAALVRQAIPDVRFAHLGGGPLWDQLHRRRDALGLSNTFTFYGARDDAHELYGAMDLLALPSHYEGLPTVIIEAMASGVPVVATSIPGTAELVNDGETGWLTDRGNPEKLAAVIIQALREPAERSRRAARALTEVAPHFSFDAVVRQYEALYERLVRPRSAPEDAQ